MEFATVAVLDVRDTTSQLVSYTVTDKKGEFNLHNLPAGVPLKLLITFIAYQPYRKFITLAKLQAVDLGVIGMVQKNLKEVTIKGERPPIVIRKDTIEFNTEAFKTRPNALVEDLLKKLPGVEVDNTGTITVNGKPISKVTIDGHDFFTNDPRIATKNLDADMVDKVQIFDDREGDPDHLIPEDKVKKIINLKFKKPLKKSLFGKAYAGAGTEGRFTAGGLLAMFRDTLQISLIGQGNNLNNTGFSINDLYQSGGLGRGGSNTLFSFSPYGGGSSGIQQAISSGVNINNDYGKTLKINVAYYFSHTRSDYFSMSNRQQFLHDTDLVNNSVTSRLQTGNRHNLSSTVRWKPDKNTEITFEPKLSFNANQSTAGTLGSSYSTVLPRINNTANADNGNSNDMQLSQSFSYNRQLKKQGESISFSASVQSSPNNGVSYNDNSLTSYVSTFSSYDLNRQNNTNNRSTNASAAATLRYPLAKSLVGNIGVTQTYTHQVNNTASYDLDTLDRQYDIFEQTLSSALTRNQWTTRIDPALTYTLKKITFSAGFTLQNLQANNQFDRGYADIAQNFLTVLPNARVFFNNISASYQRGFTLPNIGDLIPYSVVFSPLFAVTGNPGLKPATSDNYDLSFNKYATQSQISFNSGVSASFEHNGVFRQRTLNDVGAETTTPINRDGRYTLSSRAFFTKRFKKRNGLTLSATTSLSASRSHNFFELNHQEGDQNSYNFSLNQRFSINWKDIVDVSPSYYISGNTSSYSGVALNSQSNATQSADTHFNVYWPAHINIEGNYTYTYNPQVAPGFQKSTNLLSISFAQAILHKDHGEIKVSCYDILNQAVGSSRSIFENNISDTQSKILQRYFLLTLQYRFFKSLSKGTEEKPASKSPLMRPGMLSIFQ